MFTIHLNISTVCHMENKSLPYQGTKTVTNAIQYKIHNKNVCFFLDHFFSQAVLGDFKYLFNFNDT